MSIRSLLIGLTAFLLLASCSGLSTLTTAALQAAQQRWKASGLSNYRMVVEMSGDRLSSSQYAVTVRAGNVVQLQRNGLVVQPGDGGQDYTVEGLFHILDLELDLVRRPEVLGAPPGFASYPLASFDTATGRLTRFERSVGGTKNSIEIRVKEFEVLAP